jgi:hypothetical protein
VDISDKDEYDNGYSAKIWEITEEENFERTQPISQLMEKISKHSREPLNGIWCKQQERTETEEEEIRNVFHDEADDADLEVDGEHRYPNSADVSEREDYPFSSVETLLKFLTGQQNNPSAMRRSEKQKEVKGQQEEPTPESVTNAVNNLLPEPSSPATTQNQISSNLKDTHDKEKTSCKSMDENQDSMLNSNLDPKGQKQEDVDPDPIKGLANDDFDGEYIEKAFTDSNSSCKTFNDSSSQEIESGNESENASADYFDDIDEMLYDGDEIFTDYGGYTINDVFPAKPESAKKVNDAKGQGENAGRYSKCDIFFSVGYFA